MFVIFFIYFFLVLYDLNKKIGVYGACILIPVSMDTLRSFGRKKKILLLTLILESVELK